MILRLLILLILYPSTLLFGQQYRCVDNGSTVKFTIKNIGINTSGNFTGLQGNIRFDPESLNTALFDVSVNANTVNTGIGARDNHLRKEEYFNVQQYPKISFISTSITASAKKNEYNIIGNLIIKNITKEIFFTFISVPKEEGYIFTGEYKLNRRDFNVGGKSFVLSDNLIVSLSIFTKKI